jgi:hypothetical protein
MQTVPPTLCHISFSISSIEKEIPLVERKHEPTDYKPGGLKNGTEL